MHRARIWIGAALVAGCGLNGLPASPDDPIADAAAAPTPASDAGEAFDAPFDATLGDAASEGASALDASDATIPRSFDAGLPALVDGPLLEAAGSDAGVDSGDAAFPPALDAAVPANATLIYTGDTTQLNILGVTSDGYVIFDLFDPATNSYPILASNLNGAGTTTISLPEYPVAFVGAGAYPGVLMWSNCNQCSDAGLCNPSCAMLSWTAAAGTHVAPVTTMEGFGALTPDGKNAIYAIDVNPSGTVATLAGATVAFGAQAVFSSFGAGTLPTGGAGIPDTCNPAIQFAGSRALVAYCQPGQEGAALDSYPLPFSSSARTAITTGVSSTFAIDSAGTRLAVLGSFGGTTGDPMVVSASDGTTLLDSADTAPSVWLKGDGSAIIYATSTYATGSPGVVSMDVATGLPTHLASGSADILATSPNLESVLTYSRSLTDAASDGTNMFLVPTSADGGGVITLVSQLNGIVNVLNPFTDDSSHAIYLTGFDQVSGQGTLTVRSIDGTPPTELSVANAAYAAGPSDVIYFDSTLGYLVYDDTAKAFAPQVILAGTQFLASGGSVFRDQTNSFLIFAYGGGPSPDGIYVIPFP